MVLGSTQPLTEMSTRNLPGGKEQPARKADNRLSRKCGSLDVSQPCYRGSFTFLGLLNYNISNSRDQKHESTSGGTPVAQSQRATLLFP
jgi:hypothetical protein